MYVKEALFIDNFVLAMEEFVTLRKTRAGCENSHLKYEIFSLLQISLAKDLFESDSPHPLSNSY